MSDTSPTVALLGKLKEAAEAIPFVEKRGRNDHHGYAFAQALDVVRDVRAQLLARGIVVIPEAHNARHERIGETRSGAAVYLTTVDLSYRFYDSETGAMIEVPWTATGVDQGGDKGIYKAFTGGIKYALISLFLLPMTEDPEHDGLTVQAPPQDAGAQRDAERPAAPRIPRDRAAAILSAAVAADLATNTNPPKFAPVLKAKLADLGVEKIGALNVDQAEDIEAFIAAEAAGGAS